MAGKRIKKSAQKPVYKTIANEANIGLPRTKRAAKAAFDAQAMDVFSNSMARLGFGTPNLANGTEYNIERWTLNYWLMQTLFRNHWLARRIVEGAAKDMCKAWPRLHTEINPKKIKTFDRTIRRTLTPKRVQWAMTLARLFGGAGALMVIDGHEDILDKPLDLDDVAPGSYKGLITFDRWSGISPDIEINDNLDFPADFGLPAFYNVKGQDGEQFRVHSSRILRFSGPEVPTPEREANSYWGISVLEVVYEELRKRDNASWSILSLMFRAQILAMVNPELAQIVSGVMASGKAMQQATGRLQMQNELLSNQSMLILPKDGSLQGHQYSFGGIAQVYEQFQLDITGAAESTVTRLFGRTISGLGSSNEGDERQYEEKTAGVQNDEMRPQLDKLYPVVAVSEWGDVPDDLDFTFPTIRVLTEKEKAELAKDGGEVILGFYNAGVISQKTALLELKQMSDVTGIGTNVTPEDIEAANDQVIDPLELAQAGAGDGEGGDSVAKESGVKDEK